MKKFMIFLAFAVTFPIVAQTNPSGWYLGAGAGIADRSEVDEESMGELFAGYRFGRFFQLEGGFVKFGEFEFVSTSRVVQTDAQGWKALAIGRLPLGDRFAIHAGGGLFLSDVSEDFVINGIESDNDDNDVGSAIEAGIQFRMTDHWALDFEFGQYQLHFLDLVVEQVGDTISVTSEDTTVESLKLTLSYKF